MAISRSREYLADNNAASICGSQDGLINALKKINDYALKYPLAGDYSNHATSHLFIVNPFKKGLITNIFSTHPPIENRIKRLGQLKV